MAKFWQSYLRPGPVFPLIAGRVSAGPGKFPDESVPFAQLLANYLRQCFSDAAEERLHALYFDADGWYLGDETLCLGARSFTAIRARLLFARALAIDAHGVILAHNHPSGVCRPSADDKRSTDRVRALGAALDIDLLDHLIVTRVDVYSMRFGSFL